MPPIPLFDELNASHIAAANDWARNHAAFSRISESLLDFSEDQLYGLKTPEYDSLGRYFHYEKFADTIEYYHPFFQAKWHALNDSMTEFLEYRYQSAEMIAGALPNLVNTVFYRSLALMNKQSSDFTSSWLSKSLIQHQVLGSFHLGNTDSEISKRLISYRHSLESSENMWKIISSRLLHSDHNLDRYSFFNSGAVKLKSIYQDILDHGYFKDLIGLIINTVMHADGHYYAATKYACAMHATASLFSGLVGRNDIGAGDIRTLCEAKKVSSLDYIDTDYFHEHVAERFTPENIESYRNLPGRENASNRADYQAIKDALTPAQRFNYFLSGPHGSKARRYAGWDDWREAIISFALDTGTILTYKEAMALPLEEHFHLNRTQQYSDYIDSLVDIKKDLNIDINTAPSDDQYVHHRNVHSVWIESPYLSREESRSAFDRQLLNIAPIQPCGWSFLGDGFVVDFPLPEKAGDKRVKSEMFNIVSKIRGIMSEIQRSHHGVGDEVVLNDGAFPLSDVTSLPLGSKHVVSKVVDGEAKLVGVIDMIPLSNMTIVKKGVPENQFEASPVVG